MLPKLQQSSLAQSLRRDNLASQIQCTLLLTQAKINLKTSSTNRTTNLTNHGRTTMHLKIHILPSETSLKNTYQRKKSKTFTTNLSMSLLFQDHLPKTRGIKVQEARHRALFKKEANSKNLYLNLGLFRRDKSQLLNLEGIMIEGIYLSE